MELDCPTCFQKLIVPQAPTDEASKLILTAAQAHLHPLPQADATVETVAAPPTPARKLPAVIVIVLLCAAGTLFAFRGKIFKRPPRPDALNPSSSPTANDTAWKLDLTGVAIPNRPLGGRISGREFNSVRAVLEGGTLIFRQGQKGAFQLGLAISLSKGKGEELAGSDINISAKHDNPPKALLTRRDDTSLPAQKTAPAGYVLRLQFGEVNEGRLPGKIYFCAFDGAKSWVAGTFEAEIREAPPPKTKPARAPKPKP